MKMRLRFRFPTSIFLKLNLIRAYKGPRSLVARGCRSATQESLRSTVLDHLTEISQLRISDYLTILVHKRILDQLIMPDHPRTQDHLRILGLLRTSDPQ